VEWIRLAQDIDGWRALVYAVMNRWVLAPRSSFVSDYKSRIALLCYSLMHSINGAVMLNLWQQPSSTQKTVDTTQVQVRSGWYCFVIGCTSHSVLLTSLFSYTKIAFHLLLSLIFYTGHFLLFPIDCPHVSNPAGLGLLKDNDDVVFVASLWCNLSRSARKTNGHRTRCLLNKIT
jgi:hypothetical protein